MKTYVLYHDSCMDGAGAAWAAWKSLGDSTEYIAVQYSRDLPLLEEGSLVYLVDFSFKRPVLEELNRRMSKVQIIDHHKTAQADLMGLDNCIFDMNQSGAVLTWKFFHGEAPVPRFLKLIEDRDLWKWEFPETKHVGLAMFSRGFDFRTYDAFLSPAMLLQLEAEGSAIERFQDNIIGMVIKHAQMQRIGSFENIPCVNTPVLQSETANALCRKYPESPFAACYFIKDTGERVYSLRTTRKDVDVSAVALQYGGGGHRAAAGFTTKNWNFVSGA
jgi:oligoribonuclease NrnB/cAMP/cGMP phosphodiesterase (DHH superfamily)